MHLNSSRYPLSLAALVALSGCVTVSPVPGAEGVRVTSAAADVAGCTPVGAVNGRGVAENPANVKAQLLNETIALGGNTLFMTYDPSAHLIGPADMVATGVAYACKTATATTR